jgi:hypothetical protein
MLQLANRTDELGSSFQITGQYMEDLQRTEALLNAEMEMLVGAEEDAARGAELLSQFQRENVQASHDQAVAAAEAALAAGGLGEVVGASAQAFENESRAKEQSARAADAVAARTDALVQALAAQKQAANESAKEFVGLAGSLKDASEAQIGQALIGMLDPEELGAEGYITAVTDVQLALCIADEKSIALAGSLPDLASALNDGIIPAADASEALAALAKDAADGDVNTGALLDQFAKSPGLIGPSKDALEGLNEKLVLTGEDGAAADTAITGFGGSVAATISPMKDAETAARDLINKLENATAHAWDISVVTTYSTVGTPASTGGGTASSDGTGQHSQAGGIIHGPLGARIPILGHAGERIVPLGMSVGPSGPPTINNSNSFGGDTVIINNPLAMAMYEDRRRRERLARMEQRIR